MKAVIAQPVSYTHLDVYKRQVFRESNFEVRCVIRTSDEGDIFVYDVYPKSEDIVIGGLAIDIGTTTVSALLINMLTGEIIGKASAGNGQIRYLSLIHISWQRDYGVYGPVYCSD